MTLIHAEERTNGQTDGTENPKLVGAFHNHHNAPENGSN